jgi:hypothetical protein
MDAASHAALSAALDCDLPGALADALREVERARMVAEDTATRAITGRCAVNFDQTPRDRYVGLPRLWTDFYYAWARLKDAVDVWGGLALGLLGRIRATPANRHALAGVRESLLVMRATFWGAASDDSDDSE